MIEKRYVLKKSIRRFISKIMILIIIILIGMIAVKTNPNLKEKLKELIYENNFKIIDNRKLYKKYIGNILANNYSSEAKMVSDEKLAYKKLKKNKSGVKLIVDSNYTVPSLESGVVTYLKDKTIVIEQVNGIQVYYHNIIPNQIKLYDYLEKGSILGAVDGNELDIELKKDGKYLDYQKYL